MYLFFAAEEVKASMKGNVNYLLQNFSQGYLCNCIYRPYHGLYKVSKFAISGDELKHTVYFSLANF